MLDAAIVEDAEPAAEQPPATVRPDNVRMAVEADEDALYDLLLALEADNGFGVPHDKDVVMAEIRKGTRRQGSMIGVIDGADEIAASVCLTLSKFWYAERWFLAELWLFVRPEYRFNKFERDLFQFAKWCREEMARGGMDMHLVTSLWTRYRLPAKLRLWSRYAKQVGGLFVVEGGQ
jgi:hypothetical protein